MKKPRPKTRFFHSGPGGIRTASSQALFNRRGVVFDSILYSSVKCAPSAQMKLCPWHNEVANKTAIAFNRAVTKILSAANKRGRHGQYNTDAGMSDIAVILTSGIERISTLCKTEVYRLAVLREIDNAVRNQKEAKTEQWVLLAGMWEK